MINLPLLSLYAFIGLVEWGLALTRTIYTIKGNVPIVASTVFAETFIAMLVFADFVQSGDWRVALAYSFGSAMGSILPFIFTKHQEVRNGRKGK